MDFVVIGGTDFTVKDFLSYIDIHDVEFVGPYGVEYAEQSSLERLFNKARGDISEREVQDTIQSIERFFEALQDEDEIVTYGRENVLKAIEFGAVDTLLVQEGEFVDVIEQAEDMGCDIIKVDERTEIGSRFIDVFDGIGAILYFKIN